MAIHESLSKLFLAVVMIGGTAAQAQVIIQSEPAFIPVAPTTLDTVQFIEQPAVIETQMHRQTIVQPQPVVEQTITQSALMLPSLGAISNFGRRLENMADQIALGESRGMMSAGMAASLRTRQAALMTKWQAFKANGVLTKSENDAFELQLNVLNQDISKAMTL